MQLTLEPHEAALLRNVLMAYLADLKAEISNTENYDMREEMKRDEETIKDLIGRLERSGVPSSSRTQE